MKIRTDSLIDRYQNTHRRDTTEDEEDSEEVEPRASLGLLKRQKTRKGVKRRQDESLRRKGNVCLIYTHIQ